ncbi:inosine-uridine preferring nucleoside hydrolase [Aureimonas endophytica]|uniref:Inosine-uridine preferring nucleoside hydrolase n=1 Tax=Aureimonas endophytica TaxID=2027858 RepID=A0A916ZJP0_9HYPH|nr:nucleoside hydrolase [Aureimonas endophytica]GGE00921.1 inosine-uridine preferring nucleoside hydrolase [Aureimonas endophytica]
MRTRHVIFDTDPGVDDATALLFLLADPQIDLLGVTSVWGNAHIETTTRNALFLKDRFGFAAPVTQGAAGPITGAEPEIDPSIHGGNGLGDIELPGGIAARPDPRPAHRFIIDTVRARPGEVTILAVGPLTNLALALREDPDFAPLVKDVVIMGGAFGFNGHLGNVTPAAEANIWNDPEAADAVFAADWPLVAIGLDATMETIMPTRYLADLRDEAGAIGEFVWDITRAYAGFYHKVMGVDGIFAHDSLAAAYLTAPELVSTRSGAIRVVLEGFARGQTIQRPDSRSFGTDGWEGRRSHTIATDVDAEAFLEFYRQRMVELARK